MLLEYSVNKSKLQTISYRLLATRADDVDHLRELVRAAEHRSQAFHVVQGPRGAGRVLAVARNDIHHSHVAVTPG